MHFVKLSWGSHLLILVWHKTKIMEEPVKIELVDKDILSLAGYQVSLHEALNLNWGRFDRYLYFKNQYHCPIIVIVIC